MTFPQNIDSGLNNILFDDFLEGLMYAEVYMVYFFSLCNSFDWGLADSQIVI